MSDRVTTVVEIRVNTLGEPSLSEILAAMLAAEKAIRLAAETERNGDGTR